VAVNRQRAAAKIADTLAATGHDSKGFVAKEIDTTPTTRLHQRANMGALTLFNRGKGVFFSDVTPGVVICGEYVIWGTALNAVSDGEPISVDPSSLEELVEYPS
jgi:hypothetical protein